MSGLKIGTEIARVILRTTVGGTMIAHGVRHGKTLKGTAGWFQSIGFREAELQAKLSSVVEIGSGGALILGAGTPFAASAVIGTMAVATQTVHKPNGFFVINEGYEFVLNLAVASTAIAALGAGRFSVDRLLGLDRKLAGPLGAGIAVGLGLGGAAAQLKTFWSPPAKA